MDASSILNDRRKFIISQQICVRWEIVSVVEMTTLDLSFMCDAHKQTRWRERRDHIIGNVKCRQIYLTISAKMCHLLKLHTLKERVGAGSTSSPILLPNKLIV